MAKRIEDLTGKTFGRLTVLHRTDDWISPSTGEHRACWWCRCSCKKELAVKDTQLKKGGTKSCGCLARDELIIRNKNGAKHNIYDLSGEYGICYTYDKKSFWYFDKEDYDLIKQYTWHSVQGYAQSSDKENNRVIRMHRLILGLGKCGINDFVIDHINGLVYDNRKENLRICTRSQNGFNLKLKASNKSGVSGVCFHKKSNKWHSAITVNSKRIFLGSFTNFEDAVKARKEAEEKYFGEFSYDNSRNKNG